MNQSIVKYVDEGEYNAILDNPWGGDTHITAESAAALDAAIERDLRFIDSLVNAPESIAERIKELDCE